jgi:flagellar basal-body rod protein FlgC
MSLLNALNIAGSGMTAQSIRLNTVASNIANADSTNGPDGEAYKPKRVEFSAVPMGNAHDAGVKVTQVMEDKSSPKMVHSPGHPDADENGYIETPNVNVVEEMVDMLSASRSYNNNIDTMNVAKTMLMKTLTLGQ